VVWMESVWICSTSPVIMTTQCRH